MVRRIEFENFMSLKNTAVDLGPLTVFIGPNGSGKSAVFKGLVTLSKLLNGSPLRTEKGEFFLEAGVNFDDLVWSGNSSLPIKFRVWFDSDDSEPGYTLELRKRAAGWSVTHERIRAGENWIDVGEDHPFEHPTERWGLKVHKPPLRGTLRYMIHPFLNDSAARPIVEPIRKLAEQFGLAWRYRPSASDIASFVSHERQAGRNLYVGENGWGVAAELQALQGGKREVFEAIEKAVCLVFPHIKAIGFKTDWQGVRLSFRTDRSEDLIPAPQESDGVLLATFLFWRLYTGTPSLKVCLEEPENGLHPFLLADRFRMLKKFAYKEEGTPGVQLLIATHSPEFLRQVSAHPTALWKEIRLVDFTQANGSSVRGLKTFHDACHLIEGYLEEIHERWKPVIQAWPEEKTTTK